MSRLPPNDGSFPRSDADGQAKAGETCIFANKRWKTSLRISGGPL
jgi:hypothetical protein